MGQIYLPHSFLTVSKRWHKILLAFEDWDGPFWRSQAFTKGGYTSVGRGALLDPDSEPGLVQTGASRARCWKYLMEELTSRLPTPPHLCHSRQDYRKNEVETIYGRFALRFLPENKCFLDMENDIRRTRLGHPIFWQSAISPAASPSTALTSTQKSPVGHSVLRKILRAYAAIDPEVRVLALRTCLGRRTQVLIACGLANKVTHLLHLLD